MTDEIFSSGLKALTRRRFVYIVAAAGMATFAWEPACAIFLRRPVFRSMAIALPEFLAGTPADTTPARLISEIVAANLERSGRFVLIDRAAFSDKVTNFDVRPRFPDWRGIKAGALVIGRVTRQSDGRIKVEFRLWDVSSDVSDATELIGMQYLSVPDNYWRVANIISDAIYGALIGEKKDRFDSSSSPR